MALNLKRGFNRIFWSLTVGWALSCIVLFPLKMQWDGQQEALSRHYTDMKMCQQLMVERPEWDMTKNCFERIDENEKNTMALYSFKNFWVWDVGFWRFEILAVILPPLFLYGLAALFRWVGTGFAASSK